MVEYDCVDDTVKKVVRYPPDFKPRCHSLCRFQADSIVIVDGVNGVVVIFKCSTKKFSKAIPFKKVGGSCSVVAVEDNIHIFNGLRNEAKDYFVISMKDRSVKRFRNNDGSNAMTAVSVVKQSDTEFYKFGGYSMSSLNCSTDFFVGSLTDGNAAKPLSWTKKPAFALREPVSGFGCVLSGPSIFIFGGSTAGCVLDDISMLNVNEQTGWIKTPAKCPAASSFAAALDDQQKVHLFSYNAVEKMHYVVAANDVTLEQLDDEGKHDSESSEYSMERLEPPETIRYTQSLEPAQPIRYTFSEHTMPDLRAYNDLLKAEIARNEKESKAKIEELKNERDRLRAKKEEDQKEAQAEIAELKEKVKALELNTLDTFDFMEWDWQKILLWVCSLENGRFKKYETVLRAALSEQSVRGEDLLHVNQLVVKYWGIKDAKDRHALSGHIQELVEHDGRKKNNNKTAVKKKNKKKKKSKVTNKKRNGKQ